MKTTLEIPEELMRRVKLRAIHRNQKLKDCVAQLLELGISAAAERRKPPRLPRPVRLKGRGPLTTREIEQAIASGRE
jgi:hypothetical protein